MSKVSRKKLSRGVVLGTEHVFQPLTDIGTSVSIDAEQVAVKWSPFRLNFSIPVINAGASISGGFQSGYYNSAFCIPFILPPLQGYFESDSKTRNNTPQVILDEISFSFDTRSEAAAIRMVEGVNSAEKNLDFDVLDRLNVDIAILEKSTSKSGSSDLQPTREVESIRLDSILFKDTTERFNPFIVDDLNKPLDPYKSYLLKISASDLWSKRTYTSPSIVTDTEKDAPIFVGVNVSLRLRHPLVAKTDKSASQNAPNTNPQQETIAIGTPNPGDQIKADVSPGVSTEIKKIDSLVLDGLDGGMSKDGIQVPHNHLSETSSYEVIAVPMWGNFSRYQILSSSNAVRLPYSTTSTCDRRVIPINYPVVVHHVIAAVNYNDMYSFSPLNPEADPPSNKWSKHPQNTLVHSVGVGLGTGLRSDSFTYQQVAYHSWANDDTAGSAKTLNLIDKIRVRRMYNVVNYTQPPWDFELMSIPIISSASSGTGFVSTQGQPFYSGKGLSVDTGGGTALRENCGSPAAQSNTAGGEQFIEVRWKMEDPGDLRFPNNGALTGEELYIGTGGHWVYLICEKLLAGGDGDLKL